MSTTSVDLPNTSTATEIQNQQHTWRLLLVSVASLYLELVLIRWIGTEVKIFAFFQNLSLIVCFLGFGIGCFGCKQRGSLVPSMAAITALVALVHLPVTGWHEFLRGMSSVLSFTSDAALWGNHGNAASAGLYHQAFAASLLAAALFLILIVIAMVPLGRWVGFYLETAPNTVIGYSVNLLGSLAGIWLVAILAFMWLSPSYWFGLAFCLLVLAQPFSWRSTLWAVVLGVITLLALKPGGAAREYWSPYQKLIVQDLGDQQYNVLVNNEGYMTIANVSSELLAKEPEFANAIPNSSYDSPFRFVKSVKRVLVVGSGAGNDVAAALRHGAFQVDAVEIDPLISNLGQRLHPQRPYASSNVRLINEDARNFMRYSRNKYDVIIFGLLDSHTEFSGYSNMRVDNYVYTQESFRDAKRLLTKDGILVIKFEVRKPWTWIGQRFYTMLSQTFLHPPLTYYAPQMRGLLSGTVFIESASPDFWSTTAAVDSAFLASHPPEFSLTTNNAPAPTTDDWPYIYHYSHSIPRAYFSVSAIVFLMALYMVGPYFKPRESSTWQFFLLGAAFLLMETQLVSRLALYFGTTWLVNSIAISGILIVLLVSNSFVEYRQPRNLSICYACVIAALLVNYCIPWGQLPGSGKVIGLLLCAAYCVPVFFAGIIFVESFRKQGGRSDAFGANMLGAVAGGLAQNFSFVFGIKALLLIAAVLYGTAALLHKVQPLKNLGRS